MNDNHDAKGEFASAPGGGSHKDQAHFHHQQAAEHLQAAASAGSRGLVAVANGKLASGEALPAHIQNLRIPPAWTGVQVSTDPKQALWVKGTDAKGRTQSIYSPEFTAAQSARKFARVQALEEKFSGIERRNEAGRSNPETADSADALKLIFHTGIRPGSDKDTGAAKQAYGATTLEGRHVVTDTSGELSLQFTGKKGVSLNIPITDKSVAAMVTDRAAAAGRNGRLFPNTSASTLLAYSHSLGGEVKTKDFRTLLANRIAKTAVAKIPAPSAGKSYAKAVKQVALAVASRLGNTVSVALKSYINPHVFSAWQGA